MLYEVSKTEPLGYGLDTEYDCKTMKYITE